MRECEELLKFVQRSRDSQLDLAGGSRLQAARMMHTCQACQKLKRRASYCITRQKSQAGQAVCSRLELATQPSREVKSLEHPVWENLTFHIPSHPTIYIPFPSYMNTCTFYFASCEHISTLLLLHLISLNLWFFPIRISCRHAIGNRPFCSGQNHYKKSK